MKKTMKKFAAIIAAMMTVSALSSMSAFALETQHYTDTQDPQTATVDLQAKVASTTTSTSVGEVDPNADDTGKHIWNVTISANILTWDLVKNDNTAYKQNVTWNPETHTYNITDGIVDNVVSTYSVASGDTAAKVVNVENNSNFAITSTTATTNPDGGSAYGATFNVTNPTESINVGANANTTIEIDVSNMSGFTSTDYVSVGTATITLTAAGAIQERS